MTMSHAAWSRRSACLFLGALVLSACAQPAKTIPNASRYARIGVLPAYQPEVLKRTPPGWVASAKEERFDLDLGLNGLVVDRVIKAMSQSAHRVVDLQSYTAAYVGTPKVISSGQRKIIGDSRPLMSDVVRSMVGGQGLDAYMVIEGGPARIFVPQEKMPIATLVKSPDPPSLSMQLSIYIIDGRTFEIAAAQHVNVVQRGVSASWFDEPRQHVDEMKAALTNQLDTYLEPTLRQLGLM